MSLGLNSTTLGFEYINNDDATLLLLVDVSTYLNDPVKPIFSIKAPGMSSYIAVPYNPNQLNVLNSHILGLTLYNSNFSSLPDGVYEIKQAICPYDEVYKKKFILRDNQLKATLYTYLNQDDTCCDCPDSGKLESTLSKINLLLHSAKADAIFGEVKKATEKYNKASNLVGTLKKY